MLDLPPATLNPRATHDPCRNLADYALREAVRASAHFLPICDASQANDVCRLQTGAAIRSINLERQHCPRPSHKRTDCSSRRHFPN